MTAGLRSWVIGLLVWGVLSSVSIPASGISFSYPDATGSTVVYTGISEESVTDPSLALFGVPAITGDELLFQPSGFSAIASGGAVDQRTGALSMTVDALPLQGIHDLELHESGTYTLLGSAPDFAQAMVGGLLIGQVVEIDHAPVSPGLDLSFDVVLSLSGAGGSFTLGPSRARPRSGSISPTMSFSSVDLPAPFTPITHQRSLRRIIRSTSSKIFRSP